MAVIVTIAGVDRTQDITAGSLKIENHLTRRADTCSFSVRIPSGQYGQKPSLGREVIVTDAGTRVFAGNIVRVEERTEAYQLLTYDVECVDYTRKLNSKLVVTSFENQTVGAIITSLMANYAPGGFTATNVAAATRVVTFISFNYKPLAKCIEELADLVSYDWYVDYFKDLHFFPPTTTDAPFSITDTGGNYEYRSLVLRRDNSQVRNTIFVRGGEYLGNTFTTVIETQAGQQIYPLPYRYTDFRATLTGQPLDIGIDNIDPAAPYDALYNFTEKILRFRYTPNAGSDLRVSGRPHLPVIVKVRNRDSINAMISAEGGSGVYEYLIVDKTIDSRTGARERAAAELEQYKQTISEGEFETTVSGLIAGQRIFVNSASRGVAEYYIINRVTMTMHTHDTMRYRVSLVTTKTFDMIAMLQKLLLDETKKIEINEIEILDVVEALDETISFFEVPGTPSTSHNPQSEAFAFGETFTAQSLNFLTDFVAGEQTPSGVKRQFILDGSPLEDI